MVWIYELHLFLNFEEIAEMLTEEKEDDYRLQVRELNELC